MLEPGGTCVTFGVSEAPTAPLFHELKSAPGQRPGLLAREIEAGRLVPQIAVEADWTDIDPAARRLLAREFAGKAVLTTEAATTSPCDTIV